MKPPRSSTRTHSVRSALHRGLPALLGVVVVAVLGIGALRVGQSNLDAAAQDRVGSRERLVQAQRNQIAAYLDPAQLATAGQAAFMQPGDAAGQASTLKGVHEDQSAPALMTVLLAPDGQVLQSYPQNATVDVGVLGDAWERARQGQAGMSEGFRRNGDLVTATLWPVGQGTPWGVVVAVAEPGRTSRQAYVESLGSMNAEPGGMVLADANGIAVNAWDRTLIGRPVLDPADLGNLAPGQLATITSSRQGTETTTIATSLADGYTFAFQQETDKLVGDLRAAQHQRDLTLLGVLATTLAGLVVFQLARELAARRAEAKVDALLTNSQDLVVVTDGHGTLTFVSAAIEGLLATPPAQWLARPMTSVCHPADEARVDSLVRDAGAGPLLNVRLRSAGGGYEWFDIEASDLRGHPEVGGVLLTCHEIGQRKALEDELSHQATHDRLTGLPNRAQFGDHLEHLVVDGRPVQPFALLYLDLDHFKPVNDSLGHDAGDQVLVTVAHRLRAAVGAAGQVCRLGGDEFAVLLEGGDLQAATTTARQLLEAARVPVTVGTNLVHLDASIGISLADPGMNLPSAELLVRAADEAMYRAKTAGRGRFEVGFPSSAHPVPTVVEHTDAPAAPRADADRPVDPARPRTTAAGDARPPTDPPVPASRNQRRRTGALLPTLVAGVVIVAIAGIGFGQTRAGQQRAEQDREQDARALITRRVRYSLTLIGPERIHTIAEQSPWTFDGGPVDVAVANAWTSSRSAGRDSVGFLIAPDRRILAQSPAGVPSALNLDGAAFHSAWQGREGYVPRVDDRDMPRSYFVVPVTRQGTVVALWAFGVSNDHGAGQEQLELAGGSQYPHGGWSLVDSNGTITSSWKRELMGRHFTDPANLVDLPAGEARVITGPDVVQVVAPWIDPVADRNSNIYMALEVPADEFYGDLRVGQTTRDLSLLLLVLTAVAGLAFVNHRRERAVRRSEARLDALLQNAHDLVVVLDDDGRATFVSSAVLRLLGYAVDERTGHAFADLTHPDDRGRLAAVLEAADQWQTGTGTDIRLLDRAGESRWYDIVAVDRRSDPFVNGFLLTCHEVGERKALQDQLTYRARHDALTGLANRATLAEYLDRLSSGLTDGSAAPFAILFVDLDHFKPVNDTLGHEAGDEVLRVIADRFRHQVRSGDETTGDLVCRLGGDEFAVIIENATDLTARQTAERLLDAARQPVPVGDHVVRVSATIGVSLSHPGHVSADETLRQADLAMYQAKTAGRDTIATASGSR